MFRYLRPMLLCFSVINMPAFAGGNLVERFHQALPVAIGSCGLSEASIVNMADVVIEAVKKQSAVMRIDRTDIVEMLPVFMNIANAAKNPKTCQDVLVMYTRHATAEDRFVTHAQAVAYTALELAL